MDHVIDKTSEAERESSSDIKQMLQTLLAASTIRQRQIDNLQKEINDIKQRVSTTDSLYNNEDRNIPMESTTLQYRPMETQLVTPTFLSEANKRYFTGTKFDSTTQDVL